MSRSIGVSDEMYDKLSNMAESADISLMQLLDIMLQYVTPKAKIVTKTEVEIGDTYADIAPPPLVTPQPHVTPQPLHRSGFQKGRRQVRTGVVDKVSEVLTNAGRPLTAIEVRDLLGLRSTPAVLYVSPRFIAHDTQPRTFSLKKI